MFHCSSTPPPSKKKSNCHQNFSYRDFGKARKLDILKPEQAIGFIQAMQKRNHFLGQKVA
jgi:hypothetical protein